MLVTVRNYYTDLNRKMALKDSFKLSICASNSIMGKQSTKNIKKKNGLEKSLETKTFLRRISREGKCKHCTIISFL